MELSTQEGKLYCAKNPYEEIAGSHGDAPATWIDGIIHGAPTPPVFKKRKMRERKIDREKEGKKEKEKKAIRRDEDEHGRGWHGSTPRGARPPNETCSSRVDAVPPPGGPLDNTRRSRPSTRGGGKIPPRGIH